MGSDDNDAAGVETPGGGCVVACPPCASDVDVAGPSCVNRRRALRRGADVVVVREPWGGEGGAGGAGRALAALRRCAPKRPLRCGCGLGRCGVADCDGCVACGCVEGGCGVAARDTTGEGVVADV